MRSLLRFHPLLLRPRIRARSSTPSVFGRRFLSLKRRLCSGQRESMARDYWHTADRNCSQAITERFSAREIGFIPLTGTGSVETSKRPNHAMERTADRCAFTFRDDFHTFTPSDARPRPPSLIFFSLDGECVHSPAPEDSHSSGSWHILRLCPDDHGGRHRSYFAAVTA